MDSFEALIGKNINEVALDESPTFFIAPLEYNIKHCGRRYPADKFRIAEIDYFDFISFSDLFKKEAILIIWYTCEGVITDLEVYYLTNDLDVLYDDYCHIRQYVDDGEAHMIREGNTMFLGASRLDEKVSQPKSDILADKREFVLKKKYLQKIINEMNFQCKTF
jgi:hypothetical protein